MSVALVVHLSIPRAPDLDGPFGVVLFVLLLLLCVWMLIPGPATRKVDAETKRLEREWVLKMHRALERDDGPVCSYDGNGWPCEEYERVMGQVRHD